MAIQTIFWVLEKSESTGLGKLVLLLLANRYNLEKEGAWPSIATLSREGGISESTVKRSLDYLEELGELRKIVRPRDEASNQSNFYRFPLFETWYRFVVEYDFDKQGRIGSRGSYRTPGGSDRTPGEGFRENRNTVSSNLETVTETKEEPAAALKFPKPVREKKARTWPQRQRPESVPSNESRPPVQRVQYKDAAERRKERWDKVFAEVRRKRGLSPQLDV